MGKLQMGYSHIFCIIDMDTKDREPERSQYQLEKATKFTYPSHKYCKNLRNNGRMRVKFDKWLVHIPFLCYLTILLISAEGAVYGGY